MMVMMIDSHSFGFCTQLYVVHTDKTFRPLRFIVDLVY